MRGCEQEAAGNIQNRGGKEYGNAFERMQCHHEQRCKQLVVGGVMDDLLCGKLLPAEQIYDHEHGTRGERRKPQRAE